MKTAGGALVAGLLGDGRWEIVPFEGLSWPVNVRTRLADAFGRRFKKIDFAPRDNPQGVFQFAPCKGVRLTKTDIR